jgi:hypothetical protein
MTVSPDIAALAGRLRLAAERQLADIESRSSAAQPPAGRECDARIVTLLGRTLCELRALDAAGHAGARGAWPGNHDAPDDDASRDIDEFRRELARRIAVLAGDAAEPTGGGTEPPPAAPAR